MARVAKKKIQLAFQDEDSSKFITSTDDKVELKCFQCGDESLYHDSYAWWNETKDDLLCPSCYSKLDSKSGYINVVTFH